MRLTEETRRRRLQEARAFALAAVAGIIAVVAWSQLVEPTVSPGGATQEQTEASFIQLGPAARDVLGSAFGIGFVTLSVAYLFQSFLPGMKFLRQRNRAHALRGDVLVGFVAVAVFAGIQILSTNWGLGPWHVAYDLSSDGAWIVIPSAAAIAIAIALSFFAAVVVIGVPLVEQVTRLRAMRAGAPRTA